MPTDHFKGKLEEGSFKGGQGPVKGIEVVREAEEKGVLGTDDGEGQKLKTEGGKGDGLFTGTPTEKNFDLQSKEYAGPGNLEFKPKSE